MARRIGFYPIMVASFATTVALTMSTAGRTETMPRAPSARPAAVIGGTPADRS